MKAKIKIPNKVKILKRASKIMEVHEEVGYTLVHIKGVSDYQEAIRHMKHCVHLAVQEWEEKLGLVTQNQTD